MKLLGVRQEDAEESGRWRQLINCRDSREEQFKVNVPSLNLKSSLFLFLVRFLIPFGGSFLLYSL